MKSFIEELYYSNMWLFSRVRAVHFPLDELQQDRLEIPGSPRDLIFDPNRDLKIFRTPDETALLQLLERFGEHGVGNAGDVAQQVVIAAGPVGQQRAEDRQLPFAADGLHGLLQKAGPGAGA